MAQKMLDEYQSSTTRKSDSSDKELIALKEKEQALGQENIKVRTYTFDFQMDVTIWCWCLISYSVVY